MKQRILLSLMFFISILSFAQNGENDSTFNPGDIGFGSGIGLSGDIPRDIEVLEDGKIIVVGEFFRYNDQQVRHIVKLNPDGYTDTSFNSDVGFDNAVNSIAVQDDGKIIAGGDFISHNLDTIVSKGIMRLNSDGSVDHTFNTQGGIGGGLEKVRIVAIQSDGKILIGGDFNSYGIYSSVSSLARINTDGSLDTAFASNLGIGFRYLNLGSGSVSTVHIQDDGKILVGGWFTSFDGVPRNRIARLNSDGTLDSSFDPGTGFNETVLTLDIQVDGKILVGGHFTTFNGTTNNRLVRLNPDGTKDASFNLGSAFNYLVKTIKLQNDNKILVGGEFTSYNGIASKRLIRLNSDGSIDNTLDTGTGVNVTGPVYTIEIQDDHKILLGGPFNSYNDTVKGMLVRVHENGMIDNQFNIATGINGIVNSIVVQPDKKVVVAGWFTTIKNVSSSRIARLNPDGGLDTTFDIGTGFQSVVNTLAIQSDGKIIVGGKLVSFNGVTQNQISRLNYDGSIDPTFDIGIGFDKYVKSIAVQEDGKILVGGYFSSFNGFSSNKIIRLNADGSHDASFNIGSGIEGYSGNVFSIVIQDNGKIILGGVFTSFDGIPCNNIVRLNTDGSFDNSFNSGSGFDEGVNTIRVQNDGKILVGGYFSNFNGSPVNGIIRLNSDGTHDTSFDSGTGLNNAHSIVIQNNGKIIAGGNFDTYDGENRNNIVRLHADGSIDESYEIGSGFDQPVYSLVFQEDDELIVGGKFISYNGIGRNRIARILTGCVDASVDTDWSVLTATNSNATYQWVDCDNNYAPVPNETSQVFTVTQDGNYAVIVTSNATNCVDTSNCINITNASVNDFFAASNLSIYPNPNNGSFTIDTDSAISVEVVNTVGRSILRKQLNIGQNKLTLNQMANGIYYLNFTDEQGNSGSKKISVIQ
ncbi:T9SS type A sorting domain-containing protein [Brumimicrobium aurantiacum]|uniref:T9SS C-terminal target domain-containing protein n=1 Tax=Brumimicrobium aurantiacum TaxID=1737063 RepID=A0A3E1EW22_9FLAO|nr:T9SS type A sorting domain-containing protein [Brumimicrobium aurantiacum]RFC53756.1 T9SS C-terminal target domain-containing protein [Brumimicrobium aurantiacum]